MLLRVGVISLSAALALAAVAALLVFVGGRGDPVVAAPDPVVESGGPPIPPREQPEEPREETRAERREPPAEEPRREERRREPASLPMTEEGWDRPTGAERAAARKPRYYAPNQSAALQLTVPRLRIFDAPVFDSDSPEALYRGVGHVPETSMPWDGGEQTNVYLAAHRIGYYGSGSRMLFYHLDWLSPGDEVILEGRGQTYRYRVTEKLVVAPTDSWVMGQVVGEHMVSLQTCTPIPTFEKRLVVRAERI